MGKHKNLGEFDKGHILMPKQIGQRIFKTATVFGCSGSPLVSIYQKWSNEGTVVNQRQGNEWPRLIDVLGEQNLAHVDRFNRQGTVAQNAETVNAGCNKRVSEHTVHYSLLHMGLQSCRLV